jgi:hydrogenase nickel incorporation protein HypB
MCGICGCEATTAVDHDRGHDRAHEHVDTDGRRFTHAHDHGRDHAHDHAHDRRHLAPVLPPRDRVTVSLEAKVLAKNDSIASDTRAWFQAHNIVALNLVSSPGSGKTTLLVRTITEMRDSRSIYVVEGDQETSRDAELIRETGAPAIQLNTGTGCHLDAAMVAHGITELAPADGGLVLIENVGNLVCPAMFDLGERAKVAILSVTEGDDKPLKYPHMFRAAELLLLNKIDLLPYVDFNVLAAIAHARQVNPGLTVLCVSARTGEGMPAWYQWITRQTSRGRTPVLA